MQIFVCNIYYQSIYTYNLDTISNVYDLGDAFNGPFGEVDADEVDEGVVDQGGWKLPSAGDRG